MHISATAHDLLICSAHRAVIFAIAQLSCSMIHPSDRRTDGRTDGTAIAYNALTICNMLSRAKNLFLKNPLVEH